MKTFTLYLFRCLALVLALSSSPAQASFPALTGEAACTGSWLSNVCTMWQDVTRTDTRYIHTGPAACQLAVGKPGAYGATVTESIFAWNGSSGVCNSKVQGSTSTFSNGLSLQTVTPPPSCPSGATLSGSTCTCNANYTQEGSTCKPPPTCAASEELVNGACTTNDNTRCDNFKTIFNSTIGDRYLPGQLPGYVSDGTSVCIETQALSSTGTPLKCSMNFALDASYKSGGVESSYGVLDMGGIMGNYTTLACGADTTKIQVPKENLNPPCPPGEQMGSLNGIPVCKPVGADTTVKTVDKKSTTTNPDGTTSVTNSVTECTGTVCTTTTTTTNGTSVTTKTDSTSKDNFCTSNPGSAQCVGSKPGVGKDSGGSGDGGCPVGSTTIGCSKFGDPGVTTPTPNTDVALTFSREAGFGASNASCPAPRTLSLSGGRTMSMSFDMYCSFATGMRPFIIAFALLSAAGMVVFGATRKG